MDTQKLACMITSKSRDHIVYFNASDLFVPGLCKFSFQRGLVQFWYLRCPKQVAWKEIYFSGIEDLKIQWTKVKR